MSNRGTEYEKKIWRLCEDQGYIFPGTSYAGGGSGPDISLIHNKKLLKVECKSPGADWGQKGLNYIGNKWVWAMPDEVTEFYDAMGTIEMIDLNFTPYHQASSVEAEKLWRTVTRRSEINLEERKHDQSKFEDRGLPLSMDALETFYNSKGTYYLQVQNYGFFHLGEDKYNLGTQAFDGHVSLRFRAKSYNNYDRRIKGVFNDFTSKKGKGNVSIGTFKKLLMENVDSSNFDPSIFKVETELGILSIKNYQEMLDLVDKTTGQIKLFEGARVKIQKNTSKDNICEFEINPLFWNYDFFAVIKLDEHVDMSPSVSSYSLEPTKNQRLPNIKYL